MKLKSSDHFLLNRLPFFCYETIAKEEWHGYSKRRSEFLRPAVYGRRAVVDWGGCSNLFGDQPDGAGPHGMRTFAMETGQWRPQGPGMPGPAGTTGKPGVFDASGEKVDRAEKRPKAHYDNRKRTPRRQAYRQRGVVCSGRGSSGAKPGGAGFVPGACQPVSLPGIRDALRGAAAVFGLRESAPA